MSKHRAEGSLGSFTIHSPDDYVGRHQGEYVEERIDPAFSYVDAFPMECD